MQSEWTNQRSPDETQTPETIGERPHQQQHTTRPEHRNGSHLQGVTGHHRTATQPRGSDETEDMTINGQTTRTGRTEQIAGIVARRRVGRTLLVNNRLVPGAVTNTVIIIVLLRTHVDCVGSVGHQVIFNHNANLDTPGGTSKTDGVTPSTPTERGLQERNRRLEKSIDQ